MVAQTTAQGVGDSADAGGAPQAGRTPLFVAALRGHVEVAQVLHEAGANKEAKDEVRMIRGGEGGGQGEQRSCLLFPGGPADGVWWTVQLCTWA